MDSSGIAKDAYVVTTQGHILRVVANAKSTRVMELLSTQVWAFVGAALQVYRAAGTAALQKRLYVTTFQLRWGSTIHRINLNALEEMVTKTGRAVHIPVVFGKGHGGSTGRCNPEWVGPWKGIDYGLPKKSGCSAEHLKYTLKSAGWQLWQKIAKRIVPFGPSHPRTGQLSIHITRLAYAAGKVYHLDFPSGQRATLRSTDVTLSVNCDQALSILNASFYGWIIPEAKYGKKLAAEHKDAQLHETSRQSRTFPWRFTPYKKVVQWGSYLIHKEMVCIKPTPPTDRPSPEKCCTRTRLEKKNKNADGSSESCKLQQIVKQF